MKDLKATQDGNCPSCFGTEWKLAKMFVMDGVINVDTETSGEGVSGKRYQIVGKQYTDINLSTTGTHTHAIAAEYAPPEPPEQYYRKDHWLMMCSIDLESVASTICVSD